MTNESFLKALNDVAYNKRTHYALGCFGQLKSDTLIAQKSKQLPKWYTSSKIKELKGIDKGVYFFDCCGLIKGVLWGFPDVKYKSNNVPDLNADGLINVCSDVSTDFSNIQKGEVVWMPGHIGVYIGEGHVLECTPKWANCAQFTNLLNIKGAGCAHGRTWKKHGKLPWVSYTYEETESGIPHKAYLVYTKVSNLNCRKEDNINAALIGRFKKGTILELISDNGAWMLVKGKDLYGKEILGYCCSAYLKEV